MPKAVHRQHKARGHLTISAQDKNERIVAAVMAGEEAQFARVVKNLGPYFELLYFDEANRTTVTVMGSPCGLFTAKGKVRVYLVPGEIVVVTGIESLQQAQQRGKTLIVEIVAKFNKKEAKKLAKQKRIHSYIYTGETSSSDGGFEFEEEEEEEDTDVEEFVSNRKEPSKGKSVVAIKDELATIDYAEHEVAKELGYIQDKKRRSKHSKAPKPTPVAKPTSTAAVEVDEDLNEEEIQKQLALTATKAWDAEDDSDIDIDAI